MADYAYAAPNQKNAYGGFGTDVDPDAAPGSYSDPRAPYRTPGGNPVGPTNDVPALWWVPRPIPNATQRQNRPRTGGDT